MGFIVRDYSGEPILAGAGNSSKSVGSNCMLVDLGGDDDTWYVSEFN